LKTPFSLPHRAAAPGDNDDDEDAPKATTPVTTPHPQ
jgi:hypothetical protein